MSADNWTICPKCAKTDFENHKKLEQKVKSSYGKVSEKEYLNLVNMANEEIELKSTLREDWELGVDESGEFYVSYRCSCTDCGFSYSYKHVEQVNLE